jgi:hypothetical protein
MQVMINIVSFQLLQTRRIPSQATPMIWSPIVCNFIITTSTGELDKRNSDDPTPLNDRCEFSLRESTCLKIENAAAEINDLPRDEEENQDADRHQRNSCALGNTHVFSST